MPHYIAAMIGLVLIGVCFWMQMQRIAENYAVIEEIMAEVQRIRGEKGASSRRGQGGAKGRDPHPGPLPEVRGRHIA